MLSIFYGGLKLEDNVDRVQTYSAGQVVNFLVDIEARHTGKAVSDLTHTASRLKYLIPTFRQNVSVVDLTSQTVIGEPLFNWPVYTNNSLGPPDWPKNESKSYE
jgi:hypothetical protein